MTYNEWLDGVRYGDNAPIHIDSEGGISQFEHPSEDAILMFGWSPLFDDFTPTTIRLCIRRILGKTSVSVQDIRNMYGNNFQIERMEDGRWWIRFEKDGFMINFILEDENDTDIIEYATVWRLIDSDFTEEDIEISYDWKKWFSIPFGEWFYDNAARRWESDLSPYFLHPTEENVRLNFWSGMGGATPPPSEYPRSINMPISRWIGHSIHSIDGLRDIFGEYLVVQERVLFLTAQGQGARVRYSGIVRKDGFVMVFGLFDGYEIDIISGVTISPRFR
jgi:hypothetical protein